MTVGPTPLTAWRERRQQVTEGWPPRCLVGMLAALIRYYTFHSNAYDLVIFDQACDRTRTSGPESRSIKGCATGSARTSRCLVVTGAVPAGTGHCPAAGGGGPTTLGALGRRGKAAGLAAQALRLP